jgi:hypothetical protein
MIRCCVVLALATSRIAHADARLPPEAAAQPGSGEPHWLTYAAMRNDVFTELDPPIDDVGFTHDNVFSLRRRAGIHTLGGTIVHRWITSRTDRRRWDLVELVATGERRWPLETAWPVITTAVRSGPVLAGNWGGRYLQNGWHAISDTGPTVDEGLANNYPGDRAYGFALGGRARARAGDRLQGYSFVDAQLAVGGTGVTSFEAAIGASAASARLGGHVELAGTRYRVTDPYLALPGAYRRGFHLEWRVGVDVHWSRFRIGYEYRANESGSGEPIGVLEFSSTR